MRISKKRRVRGISVYKNKAGGQTELLVKREPDSSQWCRVRTRWPQTEKQEILY